MNSERLIADILAGDHCDATVAACLDALREDTDCALLAAVRRIAAELVAAPIAADLAAAAVLLAARSVHRSSVRRMIISVLPPQEATEVAIYLLPGDARPVRIESRVCERDGSPALAASVTVGASWVMRRWGDVLRTVGRAGGPVLHQPDSDA